MGEDYYTLKVGAISVAQHMNIKYACLFTEAIMREFQDDNTIEITICREAKTSEVDCKDQLDAQRT